ncbi:MAG: prolyl oligopeptidase family serine peptidase [Planctomycetota bacterium]
MAGEFDYPDAERVDHVDEYHGAKVQDPYRWLENDVREDEQVEAWVEAQNKVTFDYLKSIPGRDTIEDRLTKLWDYAKFGTPFKQGDRYFIYKNDGLQNHYVLYKMDELGGEETVLFDPNTWSDDGTVALAGTSFSNDGRYVAYAIQDAGSDWRTWKVRDVATGEDLPDTLEYLKFTGVSWDADDEGFFYSKYPDPDPSQKFQSLNLNQKVMYHKLGTDQADDVVVYHRPDKPEWGYGAGVTEDGRYLVITAWKGTDNKYRVHYKDLKNPYMMPRHLVGDFDHDFTFVENEGPIFYFQTDKDAPNNRIIAIDIREPAEENWVEIIPEADEPLLGVNVVNNMMVASYMKDVLTEIRMYDLRGRFIRNVELPGVGTAGGFGGDRGDTETFFSFQSLTTPPSTYRYDLITHEYELLERADVDFDPSRFVTKQVFYSSKDGTRVPMFIAHRKDLELDGTNPTLLYGYGGFSISLRPGFSVSRLGWMEMGGVYAVANLRGGGEYGKSWHDAGKKMNKQNVFDDFITAAEFLIDEGYTSSEKLAIHGGSNGGLLVGAVMTQRPDLFAVAVPAVGVMDMLRFDEFTAGRFWTDDYGSAKDSPEMFNYLKAYSPYHNLKVGESYPATLVTTADTDDRVVPGHSFKFAAALQYAHAGDEPVMIRIETRAGHGSGKPTAMIIEEQADIYAFIAKNTGMKIPASAN